MKKTSYFLLSTAIAGVCALFLLVFYFRYYNTVKIIADGKVIIVPAQNRNVRDFLSSNGIIVGSGDIVVPSLDSPAPRHGVIGVVRVVEKTETVTETLPFIVRWSQRDQKNLRPVELQKGTQRIRKKLVKTVYHDGQPAAKETLKELTTSKTIYRLALLNKDGSWECLYDLSRSKKFRMTATAYYPGDPLAWRDGTITFLGQRMQRGIVAVDPRVIPLKTRVYVSGYGYGWAGDTGSAIKGKRIDLGVNDKEEEKPYMHRRVTVYLLESTESW